MGSIWGSPYFRFIEKNPLPLDLLIIDEASMLDFPLMSKLASALLPGAALILLGDKDQLASVEAGAALGDICGEKNGEKFSENFRDEFLEITGTDPGPGKTGKNLPLIADHIVILEKNYRFGEKSGIGKVSRLINLGDGKSALNMIKTEKFRDIKWTNLLRGDEKNCNPGTLYSHISQRVSEGLSSYDSYLSYKQKAFNAFEKFRILCALRKGPFGAYAINKVVENILQKTGRMDSENLWYHGSPVLITENDYNLELFNGDV